jgi:exopolysaccharide biosynthesis polyprenyl glycosylphosphotransferase
MRNQLLAHSIDKENKAQDLRLPQNLILDVRNITRIIVLIIFDFVAIALGWYIANTNHDLKNFLFFSEPINSGINLLFPSISAIALCFLSLSQAYKRGIKNRNPINPSKAITLTYLALSPILWYLYDESSHSRLLWSWLITLFLINGFRLTIFQVLLYLRQKYFPWKIRVMLIGEQKDLAKCLPILEKSKEFQVATQLDVSEFDDCEQVISALERLDLKQQKIGEILVCSWDKIKESRKFLWKLRCSGIYWRILKFNEKINPNKLEISQFEGITTMRICDSAIVGIDFLNKRVFDIVASLILLVFLSIPMLAIAILIKIDSPGSILYKQTRVGLKGQHFKVWKFRTMVENASQLQKQLEAQNEIRGGVLFKIKNDPRITKMGKILRRYSLDELPQLFNVLRGEMSLVGPRPLPIRDVNRFESDHYFRHEVLPGITGLWQVSGRSDTDSSNAFNLDFEYIQNWSLGLDFKILWQTVGVVLNSKGAY